MGNKNLVLVALLAAALGVSACAVKTEKTKETASATAVHAVTLGGTGGR